MFFMFKGMQKKSKKRLSKKSGKKQKKRTTKRKSVRKQKGGDGYLLQVEAPTVGGQAARMGYSQCCPPTYVDGKVAYTNNGNMLCGGGKRRKSSGKKKKRSKSKATFRNGVRGVSPRSGKNKGKRRKH